MKTESQFSLASEVAATIHFLREVASQRLEESPKSSWWSHLDGAPPGSLHSNAIGIWGRRGLGKSAILRQALGHPEGREYWIPDLPFRADALSPTTTNVPVAFLGWVREWVSAKAIPKPIKRKILSAIDSASQELLRADVAKEYQALADPLSLSEQADGLRRTREATYTWSIRVTDAIHQAFRHLTALKPVLLVIEDLDFAVQLAPQLLETLRLFFCDIPRVAVILCGDYHLLHQAVKAGIEKSIGGFQGSYLGTTFAEQYIHKIASRFIWVPRWGGAPLDRNGEERFQDYLDEGEVKFLLSGEYENLQRRYLDDACAQLERHSFPDIVFRPYEGSRFTVRNSPRDDHRRRWLWERFGPTWAARASLHSIRELKPVDCAHGYILNWLFAGEVGDSSFCQVLIDYPECISTLGNYLQPRQAGIDLDKDEIPCEGAWSVELGTELLKPENWRLRRALIQWNESRRRWQATKRLTDWNCWVLYEAARLAKRNEI